MKKYTFAEINDIKDLSDGDVVVLDDRPPKFDEEKGILIRPGESGYDELPYIDYDKYK